MYSAATTIDDNPIITGAYTATITVAAPITASSVYTIPAVGNSDFVMTAGAQSIAGNKTFTGNIVQPNSTTTDGVIYKGSVGVGNQFISNPGDQNTFVGKGSGNLSSTGSRNTVLGFEAGKNFDFASNNTLVGYSAGGSLSVGFSNTAIGYDAGYSLSEGNLNTLVGSGAGHLISVGERNTVLGNSAATTLTTGSNNIVIGDQVAVATAAESNTIRIGNNTQTAMYLPAGVALDTAGTFFIGGGTTTTLSLGRSGQTISMLGNTTIENVTPGITAGQLRFVDGTDTN